MNRPYQLKPYIDKFNRTYLQNLFEQKAEQESEQDTASNARAADTNIPPDNVVIYKNGAFYCNKDCKLDIAINDKDHPFVSVNPKYISGLQQYDGQPFKAERWVFNSHGVLLPYKDTHLFGLVDGVIQLTDRTVITNPWESYED